MKLINKLNISGRMKNVAKISSGTMIGQIISIGTLPIYARIFGAGIIGDWTLFTSVAIIVNTFSDLGMTNAIMVEDEDKAIDLYKVITTLVLITSIISGVVVGGYYFFFPHESRISFWFFGLFIAILIFTQQQTQVCYTWLNRKKQYNVLMKNPIITNISAALIAVPLGLIGFTKYGYYIGLIIGQIFTLIHMRRKLPNVYFTFNIPTILDTIKKKQEFVKYQMPTNISAQVKNQLPVILIKMFFGSVILGYYSVSVRLLNMPITFLANAIGRVYYQTIAEMNRMGQKIGEFTLKNMNRAMKIAVIPMIFILGMSDIICKIAFGEEFKVAGDICRIVAFNTFFMFLMMSTQGITIVIKKQRYGLVSAIFQTMGYIGGLLIGKFVFDSIYVGCLIMSIVFCIAQVVYFSAIFKAVDISPVRYLKNVATNIAIICIGAIIIRLLLLVCNFI